jgi:hypothetical protein
MLLGHWDLVLLALFLGMHLGLALKNRLTRVVPLILGLHAVNWLIAFLWLQHVLTLHGAWWLNPILYLLLFPTLQAITHGMEARIPPPLGGEHLWTATRDLLSSSPPVLALAALLFPMYALSTPRLYFVIILRAANALHLAPSWLQRLDTTIAAAVIADHPAITLADIDARLRS